MQINLSNSLSVYTNYGCSQQSFGAFNIVNGFETSLSPKAMNLIKRMSSHIDSAWSDIKKGKSFMDSPFFRIVDSKDNVVTVKPVYQGYRNLILMEVQNDKYIDRILIDRVKPRDFKYERAVVTEHGSATVKTFNGLKDHDAQTEAKVNEYIENYFTKVLPKTDGKLTKKSLGIL